MKTLENKNASNAEKELFRHAGFYLIAKNSQCSIYAPVYIDCTDKFPDKIEVEPEDIGDKTNITFYHSTKMIKCIGIFDSKTIDLIYALKQEFGY